MIERPKVLKPDNDNFSPGDLREQRKKTLLEHSAQIQRTRDWLKKERAKLSSHDTAEGVDEHMQVIGAAFSAVDTALKDADEALEVAEQNPDDSAALAVANVRMAALEGFVDEALDVVSPLRS